MENFLLRSWADGKLYTECWVSWHDAVRRKLKLESLGHKVTVSWLNPDCILVDVTDAKENPEEPHNV
jgi:hypothetical protein